ncbi:MAG: dTDP-4-dehydrorhamnose reductase [Bacteroidales bacterium]
MKKILITGANGQLGSELRTLTENNNNNKYFYTDVKDLDICDIEAVDKFITDHKIEVIINCAAYTAVDKAEEDEETAYQINAIGPKNLAETAAKHDAQIISISTDYVFSGGKDSAYYESDMCKPVTAYGRTKRSGEKFIQKSGCKGIIIRTAWLYSIYGNNFVKTMLKLGIEKDTLSVVYDQIGSPTWAKDLAEAILKIIPQLFENDRYGEVFHYTNEGECSWAEFADKIMTNGHIKCEIVPISTDDYPTLAYRPKNSVLDKSLIQSAFNIKIPKWERSLSRMMRLLNK